jgi:hypothetical protein
MWNQIKEYSILQEYFVFLLTWQEWQAGNQTFTDEELEKVDTQEICELMGEDNAETPLLSDG